MEIEVGSVYEIDHSKIPTDHFSSTPLSLFSIKAVFVEEKSEEEVTLIYPSRESIEKYISEERLTGLMQPTFDEKFTLDLNFANDFLVQRIPFEVFVNQRGDHSFWALDLDHDHHDQAEMTSAYGGGGGSGVVRWAKRKRTSSVCKSRVDGCGPPILPCADVIIVKKNDGDGDGDRDGDGVKEEVEEEEKKVRVVRKRKCNFKGVERKKRKNNNVKINNKRLIMVKNEDDKRLINSHHRWTAKRYKVAEESMLKVMKLKGAIPGNPILRPDLRTEARKLIGDTGLLDHLLKHMSGKLAPGGKERFRRRYNSEGSMEYWIESADLADIRKKEGISDPFWFPPPGWRPGDGPNPDPVCAKELKDLRSEVADIKRDVENLASEKESNSRALVTVPAEIDVDVECSNFLVSLTPHLQAMFANLMKKKAEVEMQLSDISTSLSEMEEEIIMLKEPTSEESEKETQIELPLILTSVNEGETIKSEEEEEDAEKKSVRSGFKICKPIGTFLWPSQTPPYYCSSPSSQMVGTTLDLVGYPTLTSSQVVSATHDLVGYPTLTPPPPPPYFRRHGPPSPVVKRPVARRASLTLTFATSTTSTGFENMVDIASPTDTSGSNNSVITFVPDLNEAP